MEVKIAVDGRLSLINLLHFISQILMAMKSHGIIRMR